MAVGFVEPTSYRALYEFKEMEGVHYAETFRTVPVKFKFGRSSYKTVINGIEPDSRLHPLLDKNLKPVTLPPGGIILNDYLGEMLGVKAGDILTVEALEGSKAIRQGLRRRRLISSRAMAGGRNRHQTMEATIRQAQRRLVAFIEAANKAGVYVAFHVGTTKHGSNLEGLLEAIELAGDNHQYRSCEQLPARNDKKDPVEESLIARVR